MGYGGIFDETESLYYENFIYSRDPHWSSHFRDGFISSTVHEMVTRFVITDSSVSLSPAASSPSTYPACSS